MTTKDVLDNQETCPRCGNDATLITALDGKTKICKKCDADDVIQTLEDLLADFQASETS